MDQCEDTDETVPLLRGQKNRSKAQSAGQQSTQHSAGPESEPSSESSNPVSTCLQWCCILCNTQRPNSPEAGPEPMPESQPVLGFEPRHEPEPKPIPEPVLTESEPAESEVELMSEPAVFEPEPTPELVPGPQPVMEFEPGSESVLKPEPEPVPESLPVEVEEQPGPEPVSQPECVPVIIQNQLDAAAPSSSRSQIHRLGKANSEDQDKRCEEIRTLWDDHSELKRWLVETLEDLDTKELKYFHWYLQNADESVDGFSSIRKSRLEHADRLDTVDLMVQMYTTTTREVTEKILTKLNSIKEKRFPDEMLQDDPSIPAAAADKEVSLMLSDFIKKVSKETLTQLLESLITENVLTDLERDSILEENHTRANKASCFADIVREKGDEACKRMIVHLEIINHSLFSELGLPSGHRSKSETISQPENIPEPAPVPRPEPEQYSSSPQNPQIHRPDNVVSEDQDQHTEDNHAQWLQETLEDLDISDLKDFQQYLCKSEIDLEILLKDLGLEQYYREKLSLSKIQEIDEKTINDEPVKCKSNIPWYFLKKLMMVNVTARDTKCTSVGEPNCNDTWALKLNIKSDTDDRLNALDIITALFLCSDGFVQQEMALKMSMCQFSVPLLLPNCDTTQCTLMLWAMRGIVKKYRPQHLLESKGFNEERIVHSQLPMVSFVRLGECSLSKSEILNKLLSSSQQYHDTFVHHNMECGDSPRKISNGLTEITWYFPCGNHNMDIFVEPVAIANLHGDIASFETQFSFLCQTSAAVFLFFDNLDSGCKLLMNQNHKAQIFLVGNQQNKSFSSSTLKEVATKLKLTHNNIIIKTKQKNDLDFVKCLRESISNVVGNSRMKMSVEQMADVAHELGILVDEDSPECQAGKQKADAITEDITDILKYKEDQLPLQGETWKELTFLEKEEFRLRKVGSENIEQYKSDLQVHKDKLRKKQNSYDMSAAMTCFIDAISSSRTERCYFLKWMRMNLDNLSCRKLSGLRELYKEKCKGSENKEEIKEIDRQLSNSSLGTEHFFREMGQIYEASVSLPETDPYRKQLQHLPKLSAQLLLDGFPLELVDGDASNIPLRWVSDVLSQLNDLVSPKNKIMVVTVLGVQSTGKSTLLNTMFGVQFAVSSGRCTQGAFMLLIKVNEDVKKDLNCDFMVIIDTEGLKSPELAQLDNSHEHDNELATLVVGLSDITIINIAMENSTEMKDILQIVVHAFLRMKEGGKKPKCQFVHQNVSDVSAHENNLRDRKLLLQQLNEMTQAAAKMEKKEKNKSFTDVMEYNPDTGNCYVPGLWNGNPPMAPVNAGYSEAVYELKKNILHLLGESEASANNILEFREWMTSLWNAVKHENFIFSFRNSLVADAYMRLCTEFNKWKLEFKKEMYTWVTKAETRISNFGTVAATSAASDMTQLLTQLKIEAASVLSEWETKLLDNLKEYFKQTEGHVYLVERYREDFINSAKSLRRELENSVINQLTAAADIRRGMKELDEIKKNHTTVIEKAVCELIDECRKKKVEMTETELDTEFDKMWSETLNMLSFSRQNPKDVYDSVSHCLRNNLSTKGSHAHKLLSEKNIKDCGLEPFKCKADGTWKQFKNVLTTLSFKDFVKMRQEKADSIIDFSTQFVAEKLGRKCDYHDTYIQEILHIIDERLEKLPDMNRDIEFEVSLKQHICGFAARCFQEMHLEFLRVNDPRRCLDENKEKFRDDFKDVFHERDQCQKKAAEFTEQCLKPAVEDFVNRSLDPDIIDEMLTKEQFSTRKSFQYSLLLDMLSDDKFDDFYRYCSSYEIYVKEKILQQVKKHFSNSSATFEFEDRHLKSRFNSINDAIKHTKEKKCGDLKTFVEEMCKELCNKLVISQDALGAFMTLNNSDQDQFAYWLTVSVEDMAETLRVKFKTTPFETKLKRLHVNPQNELFNIVVGCGKQCPFCKVPCEAGGRAHPEHFAVLHRPQGLGNRRFTATGKFVTDICTSSVISDNRFYCATNGKWHPYKNYKEFFPDWNIFPDSSLEASDYWKYVMVKYNKDFAKAYYAEPADIPDSWTKISKGEAKASLQVSFGIK
ncbi:interferon-induced very large GTPase 1-like [Melanotaenia boesemani]|uniref:interferon-induced very large GTPase 1-like n=1 Tax=Melanotaenia boesemani TaxID=1250792 RepID=UPI001C05CD75|nr:interferon-induced very large GTPase 1-like [Melanotaenia boesemani]